MKPDRAVRSLIAVMLLFPALLLAAPVSAQEPEDDGSGEELQDCKECHLDVTASWETSPHAHAFDDVHFQDQWQGGGKQGECLVCHTTGFNATTGSYTAPGVDCQACHGEVQAGHPPDIVPIKAGTEYCGACHTTTLSEWRLTGHSSAGIGCMDCHDPHSQDALFEVPDEMCINCHQESMEKYLEDLHIEKGIGCVDCHALVIPPEEVPSDGIVPTGHAFTITPATCVACHTDALHAGFSLPGYEHGAKNVGESDDAGAIVESAALLETAEDDPALLTQQVQTLEAAIASRNMTQVFQGGVVGLVLGGMTAWFVASNLRNHRREVQDDPV